LPRYRRSFDELLELVFHGSSKTGGQFERAKQVSDYWSALEDDFRTLLTAPPLGDLVSSVSLMEIVAIPVLRAGNIHNRGG
jgi:hypothetical protein